MSSLPGAILGVARHHWRALLIFHLLFSVVVATLLLPLGTALLGQVADRALHLTVNAAGLLDLLLTPGGWLWLFLVSVAACFLLLIQQAGMLAVLAAGQRHGPYRAALSGVWYGARRSGSLLAVAVVVATVILALTAPLAGLAALSYETLLGHFDSYFVRLARPPELFWFLTIAGGLGLLWLAAVSWLYLHWLLVLPLILFDARRPLAALRASWNAMTGWRIAASGPVVILGASALLLPPFAAVVLEWVGGHLLGLVSPRLSWVVPVMLTYMTVVLALGVVAGLAGTGLHAALLVTLYNRATGRDVALASGPRRTGRLLWSAEALLVVVTLGQGYLLLPELDTGDDVQVTAHRGSSVKAPENTLPALERALADGADAVEIDVRRTADGTLVLWHDSDLLRLAGRDTPIHEVTYESLQTFDIGAVRHPRFFGTRAPTLREAIEVLKGRAEIYVDVKSAPGEERIADEVVELLQSEGVIGQSAILSNDPRVLARAHELAPELKRVQLAEFIIGELDRSGFDALALRQNRVSAVEVARARRYGHELHVWTVNDPVAMERFIDLGVDNIITDRPDILVERLAERAEMSAGERLLVRLHNWHSR
ncbi:MAG: glycerophosphodiester phosphodiesterase [Halofilum sp. (in: g-proteobacteria)]